MSKQVDEKVVEMKFDNRQFEQGVSQTMSTLDKFKKKLNLTGASKSLDEVQKSAQDLNKMQFNNAEKSLSSLEKRFSTLGIVGMTVTQNLTNSMINLVKKISDYSIGGILTGGKTRATKIENARFQLKGLLKDAENANQELKDIMDNIEYGVKDTAYGLDAAASVAAQLAASGLKAGDTMKATLRGISGVAAMTNSTYEDIGNIYTRVAGQGRLMAVDLNSLAARGMNAAATLGKALGKSEAEIRDMVSKGKISFEMFSKAMDDAFGEHAKEANKTLNGVLSNIKAALAKIGADFFGPLIEEEGPLVKFLNSIRERINEIRKSVWPVIKETTDRINKFITAINEAFIKFNPLSYGPLQDIRKKIKDIKDIMDGITSPLKNAANAVNAAGEALKDYETLANEIIHGDWGNQPVREKKLTEAGYNYAHAQNLVNEKLGCSVRLQDDYVEATAESSITTEEFVENLENLTDEQLRSYGLTEDQVDALNELKKMAEKTGIPLKELIGILSDESANFDTRFLIFNSLKNIGQSLLTIITSIGKAFKEVFFDSIDNASLFDLVAGMHKFTQIVKDFVTKNAPGLTNTFKGIFSIIHIVVKLITGVFKAGMSILNTILGVFNISILDLTGNIGSFINKVDELITSNDGLIGGLKVVLDWINKYITAAVEWIRTNETIRSVFNNIKQVFVNIGKGFKDWIKGLKETEDVPKYLFEGFVNGINKVKDGILNLFINLGNAIINVFKKVLGIHSPSTVFFAIGGFIILGLVKGLKAGIGGVFTLFKTFGANIIKIFKSIFGIHSPSVVMYVLGGFIITGLINGILDGISTGKWDVFNGFTELLEFCKKILTNWIPDIVKGVGNVFESIFNTIANWQPKISDLVIGGIVLLFAKVTSSFAKSVSGAIQGFGNVMSSLSVALGQFTVTLRKVDAKLMADTVKSLAASVLMLAVALLVISRVDSDKLGQASIVVAVLMAVIVGIYAFVTWMSNKIGTGANLLSATNVLAAVVLMFVLSKMLKTLANTLITMSSVEDMNKVWQATGALFVTLLGVVLLAVAMIPLARGVSWKPLLAFFAGITLILLAFKGVVKTFAGLDEKQLENVRTGLIALIGVITIFALMVVAISWVLASLNNGHVGTGLLGMAALMASISLLLFSMSNTVKTLGNMDTAALIKGITAVSYLTGLITGLMLMMSVCSIISSYGKGCNLATSFGSISLLLLAMAASVKILASVDDKDMQKALSALTGITVLLALLVAATNIATKNDVKGAALLISALSAFLITMAGVAAVFGLLSWEAIGKGLVALTVMIGLLAILLKSMSTISNNAKATIWALVSLLVVMGVLFAIIANMDTTSLIKAVGSLGILLTALIVVIKTLSKIDFNTKAITNLAKGLLAMFVVIGLLAALIGVLYLAKDLNNVLEICAGLSMLMAALGLVLVACAIAGAFSFPAIITGLLGLLGVVGILALVILELNNMITDLSKVTAGAMVLSKFMESLGKILIIVATFGPLALVGDIALVALLGLLVAFMSIAGILGALGDLTNIILAGLNIMEKISEKLGDIIGAFIAALAGKVADSVEYVGIKLEAFGNSLKNFGNSVNEIPDDVLDKMSKITAMVLMLSASDLIEGIARIINNGKGFEELGIKLTKFIYNLGPFTNQLQKYDDGAIESVRKIVELVSMLTASSLQDAIASFINGNANMKSFANKITMLGYGLHGFMVGIGSFSDQHKKTVEIACEALTKIAELNDKLQKEGGLLQAFEGTKDLASFGSKLGLLGKGLNSFIKNIGDFSDSQLKTVQTACEALVKLAEASDKIPNSGGFFSLFSGDNDIGDFANKFESVAKGIKAFANILKGVNLELLYRGGQFIGFMAELGKSGLESRGGNIEEFGARFNSFANKVKEGVEILAAVGIQADTCTEVIDYFVKLITKAGAIDTTKIEQLGNALSVFAKDGIGQLVLASLPLSKNVVNFDTFKTNLEGLANAVSSFAQNFKMEDYNSEKITKLTEFIKQIVELQNSLSSINPNNSIGNILEELKKNAFGTVKEFSDNVTTEDLESFADKYSKFIDTYKKTAEINVDPNAFVALIDLIKDGHLSTLFTIAKVANAEQIDFTNFQNNLINIGKAFAGLYDVFNVEGSNENTLNTEASSINTLSESLKNIVSDDITSKASNLIDFANKFMQFALVIGMGIKELNKNNNTETSEEDSGLTKAFDMIDKLKVKITELKDLDTSKIESITNLLQAVYDTNTESINTKGHEIEEFASCLVSSGYKLQEFGEKISTYYTEEKLTQIKNAMTSLANLFKSDNTDISTMINTTKQYSEAFAGLISNITVDVTNLFKTDIVSNGLRSVGEMAIVNIINGMESKKDEVKAKAQEIADQVSDGINITSDGKSLEDEANDAGINVVMGFISGMDQKSSNIYTKALSLGRKAIEGLKAGTDEHSPSKAAAKAGRFFDLGFINGIKEYSDVVYNESSDVGNNAVKGLRNALSSIPNALNSDINLQPTIRPVLDLSDVKSGANSINDLFNNRSIDLSSNLNAISLATNARNQNRRSNSDVISAIDSLSKTLGNTQTGNTYNINGIQYSEGSDVSEAINTLMRAITVERRI